jgi:DNA invertase Pin-like site-specific DNA recombinase
MTAVLAWERLGSKAGSGHLERLAVVYVRQSTRQQVLDHGESTRLQYGLVEQAVGLGWQTSRVLVIDDDLGKSGSSAAGRVGFQRLVTEITMGHVGLVLGIEMSRLARSGADWYQLLELCALSGALLADADGIYDPVDYNDRLLLGLKGTMSEAELHLLKQRMLAGKQAKARRGELAIALPTGYVRRPSGEAALDPDEQAQTVVGLVFAKFVELGHAAWGAALAGRPRHRAGDAAAGWPGQRRAGVAAAQPDDAAEHPAQPGLCGDLRLWPPPGRPPPAAA